MCAAVRELQQKHDLLRKGGGLLLHDQMRAEAWRQQSPPPGPEEHDVHPGQQRAAAALVPTHVFLLSPGGDSVKANFDSLGEESEGFPREKRGRLPCTTAWPWARTGTDVICTSRWRLSVKNPFFFAQPIEDARGDLLCSMSHKHCERLTLVRPFARSPVFLDCFFSPKGPPTVVYRLRS